jgi:3-methyladenine DNA glycosylase/8-oxoguanine DNA glycosylase
MKLKKTAILRLETKKPFNFRFTVWKPSHFSSPLEIFDEERNICYRTLLLGNRPIGLKMSKLENNTIRADIYSNSRISRRELEDLSNKLRWSYGLDENLAEFYRIARKDKLLKPTLTAMKGTRNSCPHTLFEILCIALVLQNTNVKRSQNMLKSLLENYGRKVEFDGQEMYSFFTPKDITNVSEQELRDICRVGYRAKYLKAISDAFSKEDIEQKVRTSDYEEAKEELMKIKGIGPYSASIALAEYLRVPQFMTLDIWSKKVFSKLFFKHENANPDRIQKEASRRWDNYKGLGALYLMEYLYYKGKVNSKGNV